MVQENEKCRIVKFEDKQICISCLNKHNFYLQNQKLRNLINNSNQLMKITETNIEELFKQNLKKDEFTYNKKYYQSFFESFNTQVKQFLENKQKQFINTIMQKQKNLIRQIEKCKKKAKQLFQQMQNFQNTQQIQKCIHQYKSHVEKIYNIQNQKNKAEFYNLREGITKIINKNFKQFYVQKKQNSQSSSNENQLKQNKNYQINWIDHILYFSFINKKYLSNLQKNTNEQSKLLKEYQMQNYCLKMKIQYYKKKLQEKQSQLIKQKQQKVLVNTQNQILKPQGLKKLKMQLIQLINKRQKFNSNFDLLILGKRNLILKNYQLKMQQYQNLSNPIKSQLFFNARVVNQKILSNSIKSKLFYNERVVNQKILSHPKKSKLFNQSNILIEEQKLFLVQMINKQIQLQTQKTMLLYNMDEIDFKKFKSKIFNHMNLILLIQLDDCKLGVFSNYSLYSNTNNQKLTKQLVLISFTNKIIFKLKKQQKVQNFNQQEWPIFGSAPDLRIFKKFDQLLISSYTVSNSNFTNPQFSNLTQIMIKSTNGKSKKIRKLQVFQLKINR